MPGRRRSKQVSAWQVKKKEKSPPLAEQAIPNVRATRIARDRWSRGWETSELPLFDLVPAVVWYTSDEAPVAWGLDAKHHSANARPTNASPHGMLAACRAYLAQLAFHRGWQLRIAGRRLMKQKAGSDPYISERQFQAMLNRAEKDYSVAELFDFDGVVIPSLTGPRWWELAALCIIVIAGAKPNQLGIMVERSTAEPTTQTDNGRRFSNSRNKRWEAIAVRVCCIMSSDTRLTNGPPQQYDRIAGRECVCIRPPLVRNVDEFSGLQQLIAVEAVAMAKLHLETVESINTIQLLQFMSEPNAYHDDQRRDVRADHLHGSHAGECSARFALLNEPKQVSEISHIQLVDALESLVMAIPRLIKANPPVNTYDSVIGITADVARQIGGQSFVFLVAKHHFSSSRPLDPSRWEEFRAAIDDLIILIRPKKRSQSSLDTAVSMTTALVESTKADAPRLNIDHGVVRPLPRRARAVLEVLTSLPPGQAMTGAQIIERLKKEPYRMSVSQGALTRDIMPRLKSERAVVNVRGSGYYISR